MTHSTRQISLRATLLCLLLLVLQSPLARGQKQSSDQPDEILRITSELVQTDLMVFDKAGKFVEGLKPEQFELKVDGKPQAIAFFERIAAGSSDEDMQIAAARGGARLSTSPGAAAVKPLDRGRTTFFFLDDLHMTADGIARTREALTRFIEQEMGQNDQAAILTASGQLGILQQLTGEKNILLTALKRLSPRNYDLTDGGRTPMTVFQALLILRNDRGVIDYFVEQLAKEMNQPLDIRQRGGARSTTPLKGPRTAGGSNAAANLEQMVIGRARTTIQQANQIAQNTLASLENLVRAASPIPGRKLLYFISDGFFINEQSSGATQKLPYITDAAARSGIVIYSMEARGLASGLIPASERLAFDPTGRLQAVETSAITETQQPLHKLAADTGGRAFLDTNALAPGLAEARNETSVYYLLAWRPDREENVGGKFRKIEASIKGRDDLLVRVRSGFLTESPPAPSKNDASKSLKAKAEASDLLKAIQALYPKRALPTALSIGYTNSADAGLMLTASVQVDGSVLNLDAPEGAQKSNVDVVGVLINDQGKTVSEFEQRLTIDPSRMTLAQQKRLVYSQQMRITPGLYQVRVAARDNKSARTGSANQWIEIPDITQGSFMLGSLFVGEVVADAGSGAAAGQSQQQALISVNRHFSRTSRLLFQTYVYNASRGGANASDVALQVQVFRDDQPVITVPLRKLPTNGVTDLARISYEDDFALDKLAPGRYALQVTAIDRTAKTSASQRVNFEIE
jgi:VWFA-related protein